MAAGRSGDVWWLCCWGHVFAHPPVAEGEELACPVADDDGVCGTAFLYAPFESEEAARADLDGSVARRPGARWAFWVP